jgi:UDPglucose--hexose-1-phosphate uridylyltransferase
VSERRFDPLSGEWRTFATDRQERTPLPAPDRCPLCPGRSGDEAEVLGPFQIATFDNRYPAFEAASPPPAPRATDLAPAAPARGAAEVVVWSSDHSRTLAQLPVEHLDRLIEVWAERYDELGRRDDVAYVLIFENKGAVVGATLPHPHGQIYAYPDVPPRVASTLQVARQHLQRTGRCVACEVGGFEHSAGVRAVAADGSTLAFVPFAPRFPYEVRIQPLRHATSLLDLTDPERASLARVLHAVLTAFDGLFGFPLPYVLALHQSPTHGPQWLDVAHLHIELTPPHRAPDKLKHLAGSELAAGAYIGDVAPEAAAEALRTAAGRPSPDRPSTRTGR